MTTDRLGEIAALLEYLDKNGISYTLIGDLTVQVVTELKEPPTTLLYDKEPPMYVEDNDPLWMPTDCPEGCCDSRDKTKCKHNCHYGAHPLD